MDWEQPHLWPLCDWSGPIKRLWAQTPFITFGQSADDCSTVTFPKIMGGASACETWIDGWDRAAKEGLFSRESWPGTFTREVMGRKQLALCNPVVPEESKAPVTGLMEPEPANGRECEVLTNTRVPPKGGTPCGNT